jgi:hypothetical protein
MMTPTSVRDAHAAIDADTSGDDIDPFEPVRPTADPLDAILDDAIDGSRKPEVARASSLDEALATAVGKGEAVDEEREAFAATRPYRDEFRERYGKDLHFNHMLERGLRWYEDFSKDPAGAADRFATSYLRTVPIQAKVEEPKPVTAKDEHPWRKLDAIIEKAHDQAHDTTDESDWADSAEIRARLKNALPPGTKLHQFMEQLAQMDREGHRDPIGAGARYAALFGAPVTQTQHAYVRNAIEDQHLQHAVIGQIEALKQSGLVPLIDKLEHEVIEVLQHPDFQRQTGLDVQQNLLAAYHVVIARQADATRAARLAKAERAAPIRSSGVMPGGAAGGGEYSGGLDAAISAALG